MMIMIIEYFLLVLMLCLGIVSIVYDIKTGIIPNKILVIFVTLGFVVDIFYYAKFARNDVGVFILNLVILTAICLCLFFTNNIAGGDAKLFVAMALLYPAGMYIRYGYNKITLIFCIIFALIYGYLYFVVLSVCKLIKKENKIEKITMKRTITSYIKSYCRAMVFMVFINLVALILSLFIDIPDYLISFICIVVVILINKYEFLKRIEVISIVLVFDIGISLFFRIIPFTLNYKVYVFAIFIILFQILAKTNIYETVKLSDVKKGMILSFDSSFILQSFNKNNQISLSDETLKSRLTEKEASYVRELSELQDKFNYVAVVKKIPFALFIVLSYVTYYLIWRFLA